MTAPHAITHTPFKLGLSALFLTLGLFGFGCSSTENELDVCEGLTNEYADTSIDASECDSSDRGEYIDGRCYCHSGADF